MVVKKLILKKLLGGKDKTLNIAVIVKHIM